MSARRAKVVVAPNSFKESLGACRAAAAMSRAVRVAWPEADVVERPLADGGDGTMEVLVSATGGRRMTVSVLDPLGRPIESAWGILGDRVTGIVEMAQASGLALLSEGERDPWNTSTEGTGQIILKALDEGIRTLILGIGGSATHDAGMGIAHALGARFLDDQGRPLAPAGRNLERVCSLDLSGLDPRLKETRITVACDVDNPLYGPSGAAYVYARQKGASLEVTRRLDQGTKRWCEVVEGTLGMSLSLLPGAGAAGGTAAGLVAFLGARLRPGVEMVMDAYDLDDDLKGACLGLTGEGRLDDQTLRGKAPILFAERARNMNVPVVAIAGSVRGPMASFRQRGMTACFSLTPGPMDLQYCKEHADILMSQVTEEVIRLFKRSYWTS